MEVSRWNQCYAVFSQMKKNTSAPLLAKKSKYSGQSIRAIPIRILTVGKRRSPGVQLLVEEYMEKLRYYCSVEDVHVKSNPKSSSNVKAQIDAEDMVIMQQIRHEDWVVVLDEHGLDVGSEQLADLLGDAGRTGSTRLAFCIGGPYGHGPQLRNRADVTIRLSSMVLNHQIALIVLLEQLYRVSIDRPVEWLFNYPEKRAVHKATTQDEMCSNSEDSMMPPLPPAIPRLIMEFTQDRMSCSATITDMGLFSYHGRAIRVAGTC